MPWIKAPAIKRPEIEEAKKDAEESRVRAERDLRNQRSKLFHEQRTITRPLRNTVEQNHFAELARASLRGTRTNAQH